MTTARLLTTYRQASAQNCSLLVENLVVLYIFQAYAGVVPKAMLGNSFIVVKYCISTPEVFCFESELWKPSVQMLSPLRIEPITFTFCFYLRQKPMRSTMGKATHSGRNTVPQRFVGCLQTFVWQK